MRVLLVNTFYYPNMQGGAEQSVKLLAEGLKRKGHDVAVFCIDSKSGNEEFSEHHGVRIYRHTASAFNLYGFSYSKNSIGKIEKVRQKLICYWNKGCVKDFENVCRQFQPDVVHTNSTYGMSAFVWKKAYKLGIPVIHTVRDTAIVSPVQYGHKVSKFVTLAHRMYMHRMTKFVSAVTAPSEYTLNNSLESGSFKKSKIKQCIFNSVKIDKAAMEKVIQEKKERTSACIQFMYAGRLVYFKGIEHMIKAFEEMEYRNCELHICGDGEMKEFVQMWTQRDSRIIYHGKLDNQQLSKVYDKCDVLLVPSYWPEPFGRVIIEGNMHGMPTIAGNCGGMPEIINRTGVGVLYNPGDASELKSKMEEFTDRSKIRANISNISKTIDLFDVARQIDIFEKLYRKLLNN